MTVKDSPHIEIIKMMGTARGLKTGKECTKYVMPSLLTDVCDQR